MHGYWANCTKRSRPQRSDLFALAAPAPHTAIMNARLPDAIAPHWNAQLSLGYAFAEGRTRPVLRAHRGPLRIQKGFTPEGPELWHQVIVHPPGGIASGDRLDIQVQAHQGARALLTSPGAAKWYRANPLAADPLAHQSVSLRVGSGASLEWLPLETIIFPGAQVQMRNRYELTGDATLFAADLVCLGRPASGLGFDAGEIRWMTELLRDDEPIFHEQGRLAGDDPMLDSPAGLAGASAFGSLIMAGQPAALDRIVAEVRALDDPAWAGDWAITTLPGLAVLRWRGAGAEAGWRVFRSVWALARPHLLGRVACPPRIWTT